MFKTFPFWLALFFLTPMLGREGAENPVSKPEPGKPGVTSGFVLGLPPGKHRELVIAQCIRCHSPRLIGAQRLTRDQWKKTIDAMGKHGMTPLPPPIEVGLLDYLETHCGPKMDESQPAKGDPSPWATPLYQPNPIWSFNGRNLPGPQ